MKKWSQFGNERCLKKGKYWNNKDCVRPTYFAAVSVNSWNFLQPVLVSRNLATAGQQPTIIIRRSVSEVTIAKLLDQSGLDNSFDQ